MPIINCVNHSIRYVKYGHETNLPSLLFLHGWSNNITGWFRQIQFFKKYTEVFAYDQIGHGKSSKSKSIKYSMELMEAILFQFIKKLKIDKPILVGHSMGGMLAQYFALKHPELISKVVLICTGPGLLDKSFKKATLYLHPLVKILSKFSIFFNYLMYKVPHQSLTKEEAYNDFKRAVTTDSFALFKLISVMVGFSIRNEIPKIKNDILFITGTYDLFKNQVSFYRQNGAAVRIIKNGEHNLHGHFHSEVNRMILKFIVK